MNIIEIENHRCCCYSDMYDCPNKRYGAMERCTVGELAKFASRVSFEDSGGIKWVDVLAVGPYYFKAFDNAGWGDTVKFIKVPFDKVINIETL